jgi:hypothetical protein
MEQLIMEVSATLESGGGLGQGKLRLTSDRLVFERKKLFGGAGDATSFPLSSIQSAGISGVIEKKLKVRAGSTELVFKSGIMTNSDADLKAMAGQLQRVIAGEPLRPPQSQAPLPSGPSPLADAAADAGWLDELERLAKLHSAGALDDAEFAQAKRKLLG